MVASSVQGSPRQEPREVFPGQAQAMLAEPALALEDEGLDLHEYWRIIMRHKWRILGLAIVISLLTVLVAAGQQPVYKATSVLMVEPKRAPGTTAEDLAGYYSYYSYMQFIPTQSEVIQSRTVAEKTASSADVE